MVLLSRLFLALSVSGILYAQDEELEKRWGLSSSLGNSVGIGTFVAGYSNEPSWSTSIAINPTYRLPKFWGMPEITLSASEIIGFWWLSSYNTTASDFDNRISLSDLNLEAFMPTILRHEQTGLSFGAGVTLNAPVSYLSQKINRVMGLGFNIPMRWSKWGFSAGWTPSLTGWIYSDSSISAPCEKLPGTVINPQNIEQDVGQVIQGLAIVKNYEDDLGNGTCRIAGRQTMLGLNNMWSLGWSNKTHSVGLGLGWFINFLRPLADKPQLHADNSSSQSFTEATLGRISYGYRVPIQTDLSLSAGVMSMQAAYTRSGDLAFPFFDFATPSNNQTQFFLQATVGI